MGLYIPNAKIPVSCNKCYEIGLAHRLRDLGGHCPRMDLHYSPDEQDFKGDRRADCPLLDVPPHWRLIDADALTLLRNITRPNCEFVGDRLMIDVNMIDDAPTIIPASEKEKLNDNS